MSVEKALILFWVSLGLAVLVSIGLAVLGARFGRRLFIEKRDLQKKVHLLEERVAELERRQGLQAGPFSGRTRSERGAR